MIGSKAIIVAVGILLCVGAYFVYFADAGDVTQTEFGGWRQSVTLYYEDGTTSALSVLQDGKEVQSVRYVLEARASGSDTISFAFEEYSVRFKVGTTPNNIYVLTFDSNPVAVEGDNQWYTVIDQSVSIDTIVGALPDAVYTLDITPVGEITYAETGGAPLTCTLPAAKTTTVEIDTPTQTYTLTSSVSPVVGGTLVLNPTGGTYTAGTAVTITAVANSGYLFTTWSGAGTSTANPITLTMDSNKVIVANFQSQVPPATEEDFTTFTAVNTNPGTTQTVSSSVLTVTNIQVGEEYDTYLIKDYGADYFNGDFEIQWKSTLLSEGVVSQSFGGMVALVNDALNNNAYKILGVYVGSTATGAAGETRLYASYWQHILTGTIKPMMRTSVGETGVSGTYDSYTYYYTLTRADSVITLQTFSDVARTQLVGTVSHTTTPIQTARYMLIGFGRGNGPLYPSGSGDDAPCSFTVENLQIVSH